MAAGFEIHRNGPYGRRGNLQVGRKGGWQQGLGVGVRRTGWWCSAGGLASILESRESFRIDRHTRCTVTIEAWPMAEAHLVRGGLALLEQRLGLLSQLLIEPVTVVLQALFLLRNVSPDVASDTRSGTISKRRSHFEVDPFSARKVISNGHQALEL
eukprot:6709947-Pyramimonas_sp.AAC.1